MLEHDEPGALYAAAAEIRAGWRTLTELATEVGPRPGELWGLHGRRVDWPRGRVALAWPRASADVSLGAAGKLVHEFIPMGGKLPVYARWI